MRSSARTAGRSRLDFLIGDKERGGRDLTDSPKRVKPAFSLEKLGTRTKLRPLRQQSPVCPTLSPRPERHRICLNARSITERRVSHPMFKDDA